MAQKLKSTLFLIFIISTITFSQNYTINTFNNTWCTASYPTAYVTGSWSITETNNSGMFGITKNQTSRTLIFDLPAGFEFKTAATTATVTIGPSGVGTDITACSYSFTSTTRVTATITTANLQSEMNTINFTDFEIRATAAGSGNILRNGGTFEIDNGTGNPTASESLGALSAVAPYSYSSTVVTQAQDGVNIPQYTINNQMLQIKINGSGTCSSTLTQFNLSTTGTAGTDLASNISTAKVYYTGSSGTFATTTLYGSLASPSGSFTVTGTQALANGDNYFWLTYDVPGDANTDATTPLNRLDAQLVSFVLNGSTISSSFTTPSPTGSRPVVGATFYYSREDGTWNNSTTRWETTEGGGTCSCQPNGSGVAVIKNAITLDIARTIDVVEIRSGASLVNNGTDINLTVSSTLNTLGTGYFNLRGDPLTVTGNVTLSGTGASTNSKKMDIGGDLTVGSGTSLTTTSGTRDIEVAGSLTVDGTLTSARNIIMDGGYVTLAGTGTIAPSTSFIINANNKTIPASATFTISATLSIQGAYTVTNNGAITIIGNIDGNNASSQWTNAASATLYYGGSSKMFNTNGKLDASASSNAMIYNRSGNQTILRPINSGQYTNLTLSGSGTKTLDQNISISGNWVNNTTFNANSLAVLLNGSSSQTISGTSSVPFYSLEVDNSTAGNAVVLSTPISVSSVLILTDGHIVTTAANILSMGSGGSVTLNCTPQDSSFIKGPMKHTVNVSTSTTKTYPVGKATSYRRVDLTIDQTVNTSTDYTTEVFNSSAGDLGYTLPGTINRVSSLRYFQIDRSVATALDAAQVRLYFGCSGVNDRVTDGTNLAIVKDNGAGAWVDLSGTTTSSVCSSPDLSGSILSGTFTSFSKFAFGNKSGGINPLPVEFLSVEAVQEEEHVDIKWITETEFNSDYFLVQRSNDGYVFQDVQKVAAAGNSSTHKKYSCTDLNPYEGVSYYRLKQYDLNGAYFYSNIVVTDFHSKSSIAIYPNPSSGEFNVQTNGVKPGNLISVLVKDVLGKEIYSQEQIAVDENEVLTSQSFRTFLPGVYIVLVAFNNRSYYTKIVVK